MSRIEPLPLERPVGIAGSRRGIWLADAASRTIVRCDAASARVALRIPLDDEPTALAVSGELVAVAVASDRIVAFAESDGRMAWARAGAGARLAASRDRVWTWNRGSSDLAAWDHAGVRQPVEAPEIAEVAPATGGVYWLSVEGRLGFRSLAGTEARSGTLPLEATSPGSIVVCAGSLWVSVAQALLLVDMRTLAVRVSLPAPDGPVRHTVCHENRLFGGARTVFAVEPAADEAVRELVVPLASPVSGLAASGTHLWVLEQERTGAHIVPIP